MKKRGNYFRELQYSGDWRTRDCDAEEEKSFFAKIFVSQRKIVSRGSYYTFPHSAVIVIRGSGIQDLDYSPGARMLIELTFIRDI